MSDLDAYCPGCGYICNERVTHSETCDECYKPVEWHTSDQQGRIAELEKENAEMRNLAQAAVDSNIPGQLKETYAALDTLAEYLEMTK